MERRFVVLLALVHTVVGSMQEMPQINTLGMEPGMPADPMALLSMANPTTHQIVDAEKQGMDTKSLNNNMNSVMDLLLGSGQSSERNSIHSAIDSQIQQSSHHHHSHNAVPDVVDLITMSNRDAENFHAYEDASDNEYEYEQANSYNNRYESKHQYEEYEQRHTPERHHANKHRSRSRTHHRSQPVHNEEEEYGYQEEEVAHTRHHAKIQHSSRSRSRGARHHTHASNSEDDGRVALLQQSRGHRAPSHSRHTRHAVANHHTSPHHAANKHHAVPSHHSSSHHSSSHHTAAPARAHRKGPSQVADVIEQLEVQEDSSNGERQRETKAKAIAKAKENAKKHVGKPVARPHLRDELMRQEKKTLGKHMRGAKLSARKQYRPRKEPEGKEEDDVPRDEFGLKKDCHWIQMDFTQSSDNCNQCMTVADAYFRGDDICVCYHDKPGNPMRTKCKEMDAKFKGDEDHIRELAVENQWNEYYKSYGLCENYGHCGM